jgi:cobalamin biosynthesis Mg chelatase CobN
MYDMMEEHELTVKSRDKANREMQKQGDDIVFEATRKAEDIYAASIMYTDNAFDNLQEALKESQEAFTKIYDETIKKIKEETQAVKTNQLELKSHLNDLIDTQKYLRLIDEENMRLLREKAEGSEDNFDAPKYAAPEIRINKDYFAQAGLAIDDDQDLGAGDINGEENGISAEDLDAEYFKWQEEESQAEEKKPGKKGLGGLFGKKH